MTASDSAGFPGHPPEAAGEGETGVRIFDIAAHILERIAEEYPDFVRESASVPAAELQLGQFRAAPVSAAGQEFGVVRFGKHTFERPFAEEEYHEIFAVPPQNPAAELQRCEDLRLVEAEEVMLFPSRLPAVGQAKQPGRA